jgi:hypothetical protein
MAKHQRRRRKSVRSKKPPSESREPDAIDKWIDIGNQEHRRYRAMTDEEKAEAIFRGEGEALLLGLGWLPSPATDRVIDSVFRKKHSAASTHQKKLAVIRTFELHYPDHLPRSVWYKQVAPTVEALVHFSGSTNDGLPGKGPSARRKSKRRTRPKLAKNIDKFRAECGWSIEQLAHQMGVNARTIKRHLNGGGITNKTAAIYVGAFNKRLKGQITVAAFLGR